MIQSPEHLTVQRTLTAFRLVQWAVLLALVWKLGAFIQMLKVYFALPLHQPFFPAWLQSPYSVLAAYVVTVVALGAAALTGSGQIRLVSALAALTGVTLLCIHQGSYNDMTFATAWWSSLWSVWLASRIGVEEDLELIRRAAFASRCIASMVLLGGAVGKWTDEYWSGKALYEIYYLHRDFWFFNLQRSLFDADSLRIAATGYSRMVILVETCCGFLLWLVPPRWAAWVGVVVFTSIALFSNFYLFSVLLSMIGLSAVGWFVPARTALGRQSNDEGRTIETSNSH